MPSITIELPESVSVSLGSNTPHAKVFSFNPATVPPASLVALLTYGTRKLNDMANSKFAAIRNDDGLDDSAKAEAAKAVIPDILEAFEKGELSASRGGRAPALGPVLAEFKKAVLAWLASANRPSKVLTGLIKSEMEGGQSAEGALMIAADITIGDVLTDRVVTRIIRERGGAYSRNEARDEHGEAIANAVQKTIDSLMAKAEQVAAVQSAPVDVDIDI